SRSTGNAKRRTGCARRGRCRASSRDPEWIWQLGLRGELGGAPEIDEPFAGLMDEGEEMARLPVGLGGGALGAEGREEQHVGSGTVDESSSRNAESAHPLRATEGRDDGEAKRRDDLGETRILRRRLDPRGVLQRDRRARRVETLEEAPRLARELLPHRGRVVVRHGAEERGRREDRKSVV